MLFTLIKAAIASIQFLRFPLFRFVFVFVCNNILYEKTHTRNRLFPFHNKSRNNHYAIRNNHYAIRSKSLCIRSKSLSSISRRVHFATLFSLSSTIRFNYFIHFFSFGSLLLRCHCAHARIHRHAPAHLYAHTHPAYFLAPHPFYLFHKKSPVLYLIFVHL